MPDARFQPLTGFRDFAPQECALRNYLFDAWKRVARRYGFCEWEAPTVEATELYLKKTGGELPTQLFRFLDQGERDITLRPELTASLGRIAAGYQREYTKPLKWFELGACFRYEKPQKGRLREFYQFNADILGEISPAADAELVALAVDCMRELGFKQGDFIVRVSDREAWINFAKERGVTDDQMTSFLGIVDKMERDKPEDFRKKLEPFGIAPEDVTNFVQQPKQGVSARFDAVLEDLKARKMEEFVCLDLSIVRGLAYYTGLVFEIFDTSKNLRAIAGGGRYDTLVGALSNGAVDMPATGFALGDAVIGHLIDSTPHAKALRDEALAADGCDVYAILAADEQRPMLLNVVSSLRSQGYRVDMPLTPAKVGAQFKKAEQVRARFAVLIGAEAPMVELKNMATRESLVLSADDLLAQANDLLKSSTK